MNSSIENQTQPLPGRSSGLSKAAEITRVVFSVAMIVYLIACMAGLIWIAKMFAVGAAMALYTFRATARSRLESASPVGFF